MFRTGVVSAQTIGSCLVEQHPAYSKAETCAVVSCGTGQHAGRVVDLDVEPSLLQNEDIQNNLHSENEVSAQDQPANQLRISQGGTKLLVGILPSVAVQCQNFFQPSVCTENVHVQSGSRCDAIDIDCFAPYPELEDSTKSTTKR